MYKEIWQQMLGRRVKTPLARVLAMGFASGALEVARHPEGSRAQESSGVQIAAEPGLTEDPQGLSAGREIGGILQNLGRAESPQIADLAGLPSTSTWCGGALVDFPKRLIAFCWPPV